MEKGPLILIYLSIISVLLFAYALFQDTFGGSFIGEVPLWTGIIYPILSIGEFKYLVLTFADFPAFMWKLFQAISALSVAGTPFFTFTALKGRAWPRWISATQVLVWVITLMASLFNSEMPLQKGFYLLGGAILLSTVAIFAAHCMRIEDSKGQK